MHSSLLDKDIREPLFEYLDEKYGKNRILEEKTMGKSRADVVMVLPDSLVGFEIKSDADTYARIERQVKDYDIFFDQNYVVVGSSHATHVSEHIPDHWGILSVEATDQNVDFYIVREAKPNPHIILARKLNILWRPELAHIQEKYEMPAYKQKSKDFVREKIMQKLSPDQLQAEISEALFERDYSTIKETIDAYRINNGLKPRRKRPKRKYTRKKI